MKVWELQGEELARRRWRGIYIESEAVAGGICCRLREDDRAGYFKGLVKELRDAEARRADVESPTVYLVVQEKRECTRARCLGLGIVYCSGGLQGPKQYRAAGGLTDQGGRGRFQAGEDGEAQVEWMNGGW